MNDKMRAEFEAWWEGENGNRLYCESAWRGWQASCAAPAVQGEPVYLYRRLGLNDFVTCDFTRYTELTEKPKLFETKILYTAPRPTEQQPELAKYQPSGCVICTCDHETQCQGCGAHHCGGHPVGEFSKPAYQQPGLTEALRQYQHNDGSGLVFGYDRLLVDQHVAQLVEALKAMVDRYAPSYHDCTDDGMPSCEICDARAAISAYRKGGEV